MIIYKITNKINGKVYIGQTVNSLKTRWIQHCCSKSKCRFLHKAIIKYGRENFTIEQIDIAIDREELNKKEQYWIKYYDSMNSNKGYNLTSGGNQHELSEDSRKKLSESKKGHFVSDETKKKISDSKKGNKHQNYGKHLSEETRKKISEAHKGRISPMKGKKFTIEHRLKISESQKGKRIGELSGRSVKVICVETGEVFNCITNASKNKFVDSSSISAVCKGKRKTAGGFHWEYVK